MNTEKFTLNKPNLKCICEKHGEVRDEYVFRVNMPEFGYEKMSYCLVCAIDYLSMISSEIRYEVIEEENEPKEENAE